MFDLTDENSFNNLKNWFEEVKKHCAENIPRLLIGNKSDLTQKRVVEQRVAQEFAQSMEIPYIETSAKDSVNIDNAFIKMVEEIGNKKETIVQTKRDENIIRTPTQQPSSGGCSC